MKIDAIQVKNYPPIRHISAEALSNIVVIAGPNGVGKTKLIEAVLHFFRSFGRNASAPKSPEGRIVITATRDEEVKTWGCHRLDTSNKDHAVALNQTISRSMMRGNWNSSIIYFDSFRQFANLSLQFGGLQFSNPLEEAVDWQNTFGNVQGRHTEIFSAIIRTVIHDHFNIASRVKESQHAGEKQMKLDFPDPLQKYKEVFAMLLGPKQLADININNPNFLYHIGNQSLPIESLSSGEKEVLRITFELILRNPEHCIIFFDEPELHLHPELSFRLFKALQTIGKSNQFVFTTHSSDIINAAIENSIVFLSPQLRNGNQAVIIKSTDESVPILKELGQNLGIISLGKKIVLIEGKETSLDRSTYAAIIQAHYPGLILVPSGGRENILSFEKVIRVVLDRTLWGINFYMVCDRDNSLPLEELRRLEMQSAGRLKFLPRYHLENYFLDSKTIAKACRNLTQEGEWLRDPEQIRARLLELANRVIPISINLWLSTQVRSYIGEVDISIKGVEGKDLDWFRNTLKSRLKEETKRIFSYLDEEFVEAKMAAKWKELEQSLDVKNEDWMIDFPGKILLNQFCNLIKIDTGHFKNLYIASAKEDGFECFEDILGIFAGFEALS